MAKPIAAARALRVGAKRPDLAARRVSLLVRLAVRVTSLHAQLAWLLVLMGVGVSLRVVPRIRIHPPQYDMRGTAMVITHTLDNITYELVVGDQTYRASGLAPYLHAQPGALIDVWYDRFDPGESALYAHAPYDFGPGSFAILAFPGAALVVAVLTMWQRRKRRLLRYGIETSAKAYPICDGSAGGRTANLELRYEIAGTTHHTNLTTVRPPDRAGESEPILYDPHNPEYSIALADLPGRPIITNHRLVPTRIPILPFALPLVTLSLIALLAVRAAAIH